MAEFPTLKQLSTDDAVSQFIKKNSVFFKNILKALHQCQKIIRSTESVGLLRGVKSQESSYFRTKPKTLRNPVDVVPAVDRYIEDFRRSHFSHIPSRQRSVFCYWIMTQDEDRYENVGSYGTPFVIVPKDGAVYFQTKEERNGDLYDSNLYTKIKELLSESPPDSPRFKAEKKKVDNLLNGYFKNSVSQFAQFRIAPPYIEVVIEHKGYYAFNRSIYGKWESLIDDFMFSDKSLEIIKKEM